MQGGDRGHVTFTLDQCTCLENIFTPLRTQAKTGLGFVTEGSEESAGETYSRSSRARPRVQREPG